jgi:membrane-bound ClpP family serine protease
MLEIAELFAKTDGIAGLVILALFILIGSYLRALSRQNELIIQEIKTNRSEFKIAIIQAKNCILKMFYDEEVLTDRRKRNRHVDEDRRDQ